MTDVRLNDGYLFRVVCPYRRFARRWRHALVGNRWRRFWVRFHRAFGVRLRSKPRLMPVVCRDGDGQLRQRWLNPLQIIYIAEP